MTFAYRYSDSKLSHRTSWGPVTSKIATTPTKLYQRPISESFDRIYNAFEKTNAFEIVQDNEREVAHKDIVVNHKHSSFDRADCGLASKQTPCTDEEVTNYYREKILYSQARQLFPLQEDLADWISKTIGITYLTGDNFLDVLDNGVELCQLATYIQEKAKESKEKGLYEGPIPTIRGRCWQRAARRSFFSRDNMENFILFCKQLGVHENLLFESDDLVLQSQPRQVILCLLEVARLVSKFGVEPPGLVQLEREIALEEHDSGLDSGLDIGWQFCDNSPEPDKNVGNPPPSVRDSNNDKTFSVESEGSVKTDDSGEESIGEPPKPLTTELDKRVQIMTRLMQRNCNCSSGKCSKLVKVKKVGEGRYNIAGRNVFIRLLKGRHMMVRVGGGWDTLEHFLSRHDPCQVRLIHATTPSQMQTFTLPIHSPSESNDEPKARRKSMQSSASSISGRSTPARITPASSRAGSVSGKTSPSSSCSDKQAPNFEVANMKKLKKSLTLPLKVNLTEDKSGCVTPTKTTVKKNITLPLKVVNGEVKGSKSRPTTPSTRPRKQSSPACFSTPTTPSIKSKPIGENRKSLSSIGTVKKTRSMSFATTSTPSKIATLSRSSSANVKSLISPSDIEKSIRKSLPQITDSPTKPFLHIKAKYRSPPPREVPPR